MTHEALTVASPAEERYRFIAGTAGTGKTTMVRQQAEEDETILLCATTGIAAMNLGGTTINALLGYFDTDSLQIEYELGRLGSRLKRLAEVGYTRIIVDEASMMDGRQLDILCLALDELEDAHPDEALGLTLVGDMCLAVGTRVMRADGVIAPVEALQVGDQVMGPDSRPRTILRRKVGRGRLYRVDQTNGMSYTVNAAHLLALRRSTDGQRIEPWGKRYPKHGAYCTVPAAQFLRASRKFKECFVGYRAGCIQFPSRPIEIDPYFLGVWLGDGDSGAPRITSGDVEVQEYCRQYARQLGLKVSVTSWEPRTHAIRLGLSHGRARGNAPNPLLTSLRGYRILNQKRIPSAYLYNSEDVRCKVLAGLLDTDGGWHGNRYTITQVNHKLAQDIKQLADQLGFRTGLRLVTNPPCAGRAWTVSIGGDTWRIPCHIPRKQSKVRRLVRSRLTSVLRITETGVGEYVGFTLDGDQLFLLADGTVAHNCQLPPVKAPFVFESKMWDRFEAHTTLLMKPWRQADPTFVAALQALRRGDVARSLPIFQPRIFRSLEPSYVGTTLMAKNDEVDRHNRLRLLRCPGTAFTCTSERWGSQRPEWKHVPETLELKEGALVMILANQRVMPMSTQFLYVNGDLGIVQGLEAGGTVKVLLQRNAAEVSVALVTRQFTEPNETGRGKKVVGELTYMPLRLAYATTVHKSQGLSLDTVQMTLGSHFWTQPGMLYVACSRARTLAGLRIVGLPQQFADRTTVNKKVTAWL